MRLCGLPSRPFRGPAAVLCAALAGAVVTLASSPASAQGVDEFGAYGGMERTGPTGSPQNYAFEIRFGPYPPSIDEEFGGTTPFEDTFGKKKRYLIGVEFDWQALRIPWVGTVGPGFGLGYTRYKGDTFVANSRTERAQQETTLTLLPAYAVAVLRVDVLARETPIPLAAYGKLGLGYALWSVSDGDGVADYEGTKGRGASYGWQFALGGMFLLDCLDESSAIEMDNTTGVNNSYFFFEWYDSTLDCFGGDCMHVGTSTWMLGLALEL
jgi:hypothetical protein